MSVVLRLVLDQHGQLLHGELVGDATTRPARFNGWRGLTHAVRTWLTRQATEGTSDEPWKPKSGN